MAHLGSFSSQTLALWKNRGKKKKEILLTGSITAEKKKAHQKDFVKAGKGIAVFFFN